MRSAPLLALMAAVAATSPAPALAARDALLAPVRAAAASGALAPPQAVAYGGVVARARAVRARLHGVRRRELSAALRIATGLARRGALVPARMPAVFLTLERNAEWWAANGPPTAGSPGENGARGRVCRPLPARVRAARVSFAGSELEFQYYRGLGLQLQVNGAWSKANALLGSTRPALVARGAALLAELLPLGATRDGVLTWEYLFPIFGGHPPWISALSQATAVQAMTRAAVKLGRPDLIPVAGAAAAAFAYPPPAGVRVGLGNGAVWYALYGFAPRLRVLNAHLQAVSALFDLARASGDPRTEAAYQAGLLAAHRRIGAYDTGVWSRYARPGGLANLNYHVLNRDLAAGVCRRSGDAAVCGAAASFASELERRCPRPAEAARRG